jgi:hypothetical protein
VPILVAIDDLNRIVYLRRDALNQRNLVLDSNRIAHDQRLRIVRARAYSVDRAATGFNPDEVVSEIVELLLDAGLPRFADRHYTDYRRDPDRDS